MSGPAAARAWVDHLRAGGTTPWAQWRAAGPDAPSAEAPTPAPLPGAQQLELLRRLNAAGPVPAGLAERVLRATAAGRGPIDLRLVGADEHRWGPRPVDPAALAPHQLLRVAASVLAEDVLAAGEPPAPPEPRRLRPAYALVGDPVVVDATVTELAARGLPPGGRRPRVLVVAGAFDDLLASAWSRRCFDDGVAEWEDWLEFWSGRDAVPPRLRLAGAARRAAGRGHRVRVVASAAALPAELRRLRLGAATVPAVPGADVADLARRVSMVLRILTPRERAADLMARTWWPQAPASDLAPVRVPERFRGWSADAAQRVARDLRRAGYPVVGDPAALTARPSGEGAVPEDLDAAVLDLAVRMLLAPPAQPRQTTVTPQRSER